MNITKVQKIVYKVIRLKYICGMLIDRIFF